MNKQTTSSPQELVDRIRGFLTACKRPAVSEPGGKPLPLDEGSYTLAIHGPMCVLHAWGTEGNIVRRISSIERETRERMDLRARRFGKGEALLALVDRSRLNDRLSRRVEQEQFLEYFRRLLAREFHSWSLSHLSNAPDLEHSLSPLFVRGLLSSGRQAWAVIGAPRCLGPTGCDQILSFALIWLDLLRRRTHRQVLCGLKIFVPSHHSTATANRLAFLDQSSFRFELYEFDRSGTLTRVDERDYGNLSTELPACSPIPTPAPPVDGWITELQGNPEVDAIPRPDGLVSLKVRGVTFALAGKGVMTYGLEQQRPVVPHKFPEVVALAKHLARFRSPDAIDPENPLYRKYPERWLESVSRRRLSTLDSALHREPLYSQIPAVAGIERGIIDLLACDQRGRLAVIELKVGEDIHLPLQGLDYWMRVKWHLDRDETTSKGYFPGIGLLNASPRLLLVSPAFQFHPTTEVILRYFSPSIPVERIGLGADWRRHLTIVFRKSGAERLA